MRTLALNLRHVNLWQFPTTYQLYVDAPQHSGQLRGLRIKRDTVCTLAHTKQGQLALKVRLSSILYHSDLKIDLENHNRGRINIHALQLHSCACLCIVWKLIRACSEFKREFLRAVLNSKQA